MSTLAESDEVAPVFRAVRIIHLGLLCGPIGFLCVALYLQLDGHMGPPPNFPFLSYFGVIFAVVAVLARWQLLLFATRSLRQLILTGSSSVATAEQPEIPVPRTEVGRLAAAFQTQSILGAALLEGPTFLFLTAYLIEGSLISLAGAAFLFAWLIAIFPARASFERWIAGQQELLDEERQRGS